MKRLPLEIDGKTYWLKIGLKSIIYLQSLPRQTEEDIFVASILTLQDISINAAKRLYQRAAAVFNDDIYKPLFEQASSFLSLDVRDLYIKALGELRIDLAQFFIMSPEEIELAYEGYLRQQQLTANLTKLAIVSALAKDPEPIVILNTPEYTIGTDQERDKTFDVLEREL